MPFTADELRRSDVGISSEYGITVLRSPLRQDLAQVGHSVHLVGRWGLGQQMQIRHSREGNEHLEVMHAWERDEG